MGYPTIGFPIWDLRFWKSQSHMGFFWKSHWDFLEFFSDRNDFFKVKRKFCFMKKLLETGRPNCFWLQEVSLNIFIQIRHIHLGITQPPKFWPLCVLEVELLHYFMNAFHPLETNLYLASSKGLLLKGLSSSTAVLFFWSTTSFHSWMCVRAYEELQSPLGRVLC